MKTGLFTQLLDILRFYNQYYFEKSHLNFIGKGKPTEEELNIIKKQIKAELITRLECRGFEFVNYDRIPTILLQLTSNQHLQLIDLNEKYKLLDWYVYEKLGNLTINKIGGDNVEYRLVQTCLGWYMLEMWDYDNAEFPYRYFDEWCLETSIIKIEENVAEYPDLKPLLKKLRYYHNKEIKKEQEEQKKGV